MNRTALDLLKSVYGYPEFRGHQAEVVADLAGGRMLRCVASTHHSSPSVLHRQRLLFSSSGGVASKGSAVMENIDIERLVTACRRHGMRKVALFGSYVRGEAGPDSDIDLIVDFLNPTGFLALVKLERELSETMGRKVDLLTEQAISPHLRERIQNEQQVIYEAAG